MNFIWMGFGKGEPFLADDLAIEFYVVGHPEW